MKDAIKKAIEGGLYCPAWEENPDSVVWQLAVCDPLFWQSFGKALGWKDLHYEQAVGHIHPGRPIAHVHRQDWRKKWHRFIDHLAEGKDADTFFKELLSSHT